MITSQKIVSLGFLSIGVFLLLQVALPILSYEVWEVGQRFSNQVLISPNSPSSAQVLGVSIKNEDNFPQFYSNLTRDTKANYSEFTITIPKLAISDEKVLVDSNDLSKSLAHLPGSALPGEKGNVFISGHSALSQLLSLKKVIFEKLLDLKIGDQITIDAMGAKFKYEVVGFKVVDPSDLSVVKPPDEIGRYISLMTCVPPGLNFKRLVVLGKMI